MSVENNPYGAPSENPSTNSAAVNAATRSVMIRRVDVISVAKVMGGLHALIGLIFGVFITLMTLAGVAAGGGQGLGGGLIFGVGAIVIWPIFNGIIGLIGGLITGLLYNLVAGMVGGIGMDLET